VGSSMKTILGSSTKLIPTLLLRGVVSPFELIDEVVDGEENVLSDTKLLRNHFEEVHPRQTEDEEGDVEDCDTVLHFRGEACEGVRTFIHRAVGEQQIKQ
jgi:hypothetical protein